jgi:hypothetical protein
MEGEPSMSTNYKPNNPFIKPLSELPQGQIRLGIQAAPFAGKTYSALTFPNPVIASFDRKANAHSHRTDVFNVPFYDGVFCDSVFKRNGLATPPNRRDALLKWLAGEALQIPCDHTLILDNSTGIEEAFHTQYWLNPVVSKQGEVDSFAEWRQKVDFFGDLATAIKGLKCNVIYITHEQDDRDKKGDLNGGIRPLLTGQAGDKLAGNYTDWFAMKVIQKPQTKEEIDSILKSGITKVTLDEWVASTPPDYKAIHLWQTQPDNVRRSLGTTTLQGCPKYVVANYSSFDKYRRK